MCVCVVEEEEEEEEEEEGGGRRAAGGEGGNAEPKTRTPHKDVGNNRRNFRQKAASV